MQTIIKAKKSEKHLKGTFLANLGGNNDTIEYLMESIVKAIQQVKVNAMPLINCIGNIIAQIDKCSLGQSRAVLTKAIESTVIIIFLYFYLVC